MQPACPLNLISANRAEQFRVNQILHSSIKRLMQQLGMCRWCLQETVLAESAMMVPDTRQRLETALSDLNSFVVSYMTGTAAASASSVLNPLTCVLLGTVKHTSCKYQQLNPLPTQPCVMNRQVMCTHHRVLCSATAM
jgi:hypothetical protein